MRWSTPCNPTIGVTVSVIWILVELVLDGNLSGHWGCEPHSELKQSVNGKLSSLVFCKLIWAQHFQLNCITFCDFRHKWHAWVQTFNSMETESLTTGKTLVWLLQHHLMRYAIKLTCRDVGHKSIAEVKVLALIHNVMILGSFQGKCYSWGALFFIHDGGTFKRILEFGLIELLIEICLFINLSWLRMISTLCIIER